MPEVWRRSTATLLAVDDLDRQLAPLERELRPLARSDERAKLLMTIPGVAELLGVTIASELDGITRFPSARRLVGYSGLSPRIKQSGQSERMRRLSKAGPTRRAGPRSRPPSSPGDRTRLRRPGCRARTGRAPSQGGGRVLDDRPADRTAPPSRSRTSTSQRDSSPATASTVPSSSA